MIPIPSRNKGDNLTEKTRAALGLLHHVVKAEDSEDVITKVKEKAGEPISDEGSPSQVVSQFPSKMTKRLARKDKKTIALLTSLGYDTNVTDPDDLDLPAIEAECRKHLEPLM